MGKGEINLPEAGKGLRRLKCLYFIEILKLQLKLQLNRS